MAKNVIIINKNIGNAMKIDPNTIRVGLYELGVRLKDGSAVRDRKRR